MLSPDPASAHISDACSAAVHASMHSVMSFMSIDMPIIVSAFIMFIIWSVVFIMKSSLDSSEARRGEAALARVTKCYARDWGERKNARALEL
jgi:flagellar biogenesis protein FliO